MTPLRHAQLVYKRAGKGAKRKAYRALVRVAAQQLRRELEQQSQRRAA